MLFPAKGLPPALIEFDEAGDRIARYLKRGDVSAETPSQIEAVLGKIPTQLLERDRADGELRVRTTDDGKCNFSPRSTRTTATTIAGTTPERVDKLESVRLPDLA